MVSLTSWSRVNEHNTQEPFKRDAEMFQPHLPLDNRAMFSSKKHQYAKDKLIHHPGHVHSEGMGAH